MIVEGALRPGEPLRETKIAEVLGVSRNTLREAFRSLANDGLVVHEMNRGTRVNQLSAEAIREIYELRRFIEIPALRDGRRTDEVVARMRASVAAADAARHRGEWIEVGTADLDFHRAIVSLTGNSRLIAFHEKMAAELRLAFGVLDPEVLHEPFIDRNVQIAARFADGEAAFAAELLADYLSVSENLVLSTHLTIH